MQACDSGDDRPAPTWTFDRLAALSLELGASLAPIRNYQESAEFLLGFCLQQIGPADSATMLSRIGSTVDTLFATDPDGRSCDRLQIHFGHGPGFETLRTGVGQRCPDLCSDPELSTFGQHAFTSFGWRAMIAVPLPGQPDGRDLVVTLYSRQPNAFTDADEIALRLLVAHGGLDVLATAHEAQVAHLRRALESNRDIGAAIGILMARRLLTREQAFRVLRAASQNGHRKLADVAQEVLETGTLEPA